MVKPLVKQTNNCAGQVQGGAKRLGAGLLEMALHFLFRKDGEECRVAGYKVCRNVAGN